MLQAMADARSIRGLPMKSKVLRSFKKAHVIGMFVLAVGFLATPVLMPSESIAQDARVAKSMAALKDSGQQSGGFLP